MPDETAPVSPKFDRPSRQTATPHPMSDSNDCPLNVRSGIRPSSPSAQSPGSPECGRGTSSGSRSCRTPRDRLAMETCPCGGDPETVRRNTHSPSSGGTFLISHAATRPRSSADRGLIRTARLRRGGSALAVSLNATPSLASLWLSRTPRRPSLLAVGFIAFAGDGVGRLRETCPVLSCCCRGPTGWSPPQTAGKCQRWRPRYECRS
jgi:hypothetical protein